jgi:hypothetical protein
MGCSLQATIHNHKAGCAASAGCAATAYHKTYPQGRTQDIQYESESHGLFDFLFAGPVPVILHQRLVITYDPILKASFITPSSESTSSSSPLVADGHGAAIDLEVVLEMVISETSGPLSSVGAGCQAFPACELLGAARGLKMLLAELFIVALAKAGFLQVANLNVNGGDFFIKVMELGDIGGDTPIVELSSRHNHGKELGVWAIDDGIEPAWECFNGLVGGVGRGSVDGNDVGRVLGPVVGREGGNFTVVKTFDPFGGEVEAGPNGDFE